MAFEPELRSGAPWAMEEMILGERELVSQLLASAEARQAGVMIGSAVRREQPLYRAAAQASGM